MGIVPLSWICGYFVSLKKAKPELIKLLDLVRDDEYFGYDREIELPNGLVAQVYCRGDWYNENTPDGLHDSFHAVIGFSLGAGPEFESGMCCGQFDELITLEDMEAFLTSKKQDLVNLKKVLDQYVENGVEQPTFYLTS
jgi:hypothetical protein